MVIHIHTLKFIPIDIRHNLFTHTYRVTHAHPIPIPIPMPLTLRIAVVVCRDILTERAQQDHGNHDGEEEHDHDAVRDAEPVHLYVDMERCIWLWMW